MQKKIKMKAWQGLKQGDVVDLVAPGFRSGPEELRSAEEFIRSWGLVPRVPQGIFGDDVLSSNSDEARFQMLKSALTAPDSQAVWCLRGGYGSIRLLPDLLKLKKPAGDAKLFLGLSDITSIHLFLNQHWLWPTLHAPVAFRMGAQLTTRKKADRYAKELKRLVFAEEAAIIFEDLRPMNGAAREKKQIRGEICGGNIVTLQSSLATDCEWQTDGKILFFEEVGERGYRLDRMFTQFAQAKKFRKAKAILFGDITGGFEPDGQDLRWPVIERFAKSLSIPVLKGVQSGHDKIQRPVPFGTRVVLNLEERELICASGVKL